MGTLALGGVACHFSETNMANKSVDPDVWPVKTSGGLKSISDDDLCASCAHCKYRPGDMRSCDQNWPGLENSDGYVIHCLELDESSKQ